MRKVSVLRCPYLGIYVNSFAVAAGQKHILIDSGLASGRGALAPYANADTALLCTHGHWDHIGNHRYLQAGGAAIYAHAADARYLSDYDWHWNALFEQFKADFDLLAARRTTFVSEVGEPFRPDEYLRGGETLIIGDCRVTVLHTPGHSAGSVSFLLPDDGVLFTGDSLMGDGFFTGLPQYTDPAAYIASMERLCALSVETVYCNHNEPMEGKGLTDKAERSIACVRRTDRAVKAFVEGYRGAPEQLLGECVKAVCAAEGKNPGGGACVTVLAHIRAMGELPETAACRSAHIAL